MKSFVVAKASERKYPYLGLDPTTGTIVFFYDTDSGVVVAKGTGPDPIGFHCEAWAEHAFLSFTGEVTLTN